jgi:hypothetical protein
LSKDKITPCLVSAKRYNKPNSEEIDKSSEIRIKIKTRKRSRIMKNTVEK